MDLQRLFYPESVAVVGASPHLGGGKMPYYQLLQMAGFKGRLYPVNPKYGEIAGVKVYASLDDIPESVDLAIAAVPADKALETVKAAARKGIRYLHFFTSGFSEVGNKELEAAMVEAARAGDTRIVGPNCIGIHCQSSGVTCDVPKAPLSGIGTVAFLGQSGGMTHNFMRMAGARYLELNKIVSYGNQIDLRVEDYLEYLAEDDTVKVIAGYIEDIKNGRRFMEALGKTTARKPVVILKGGITAQGAKAAFSHTGAMAASHEIWTAAMRQQRVIEALNFEQLVDMTMMAVADKTPAGKRLGFLGAGGGTSVLFTDFSTLAGLSLPELSEDVQKQISLRISNVNTSTTNPVDLGFYGFDFTIMAHTIEAMAQDDHIDAIIPYFSLDFITSFQRDQIESGPYAIVEAAQKTDKPVIPILSQFTENLLDIEEVRIKMYSIFRKAGMAVYRTPQDAIASIHGYLRWRLQPGSFSSMGYPACEQMLAEAG
ncbi:MAG TPA: CoA-binding protein [Deltaproteobacteria bacterium]|nr:CoA-binding protein [Deltaproteobacteria bacterium]HPR53908.1 CoA-binding protein [Deltaproteobacteria bacterium]HXK46708.1 CoA-binding protein [Deltaproteobacteria bacterium]